MLSKFKRRVIMILIAACAFLTAGCGGASEGDYYYVSNGVSLSKSQAEDFERAFELSSSRLQEAIDVPLDESAYTSYKKELDADPFPEARVWSGDINSASRNIDRASDDIASRSETLNQSLDDEAEE